MEKITKKQYTRWFFTVVAVLAVIRAAIIALSNYSNATTADVPQDTLTAPATTQVPASTKAATTAAPATSSVVSQQVPPSPIFTGKKHPIYSVPTFKNTFPDMQDVQIAAALKHGVKSVENREDAEHRKKELVYVGANPYFHIDRLNWSIPYLVPRASVLVQDIGKAFFDSLYVKHIPMHKIILTSLLRTKDDIQKLQQRNVNATDNSCHLYGTTVDICYNRYLTVSAPDGKPRRKVQNDTLKWVLSEVLRDFREQQRCYVKYEVKQGCFHITVR